MTPKETDFKLQREASNRADFIRRIFAVIVSVGFANRLIQIDSVRDGVLPTNDDLIQFTYLTIGLGIIVQSWEEYFVTIEELKLINPGRFYLDIIILFSYLLLLTYSKSPLLFMLFLSLIFLYYCAWEIFAYSDHPSFFAKNPLSKENERRGYIYRLMYSIWDRKAGLRRSLSTILAFLYFAMLYFIYLDVKHDSGVSEKLKCPYIYAGLILMGIVGYRIDKARPKRFGLAVIPAAVAIIVFLFVHFHFSTFLGRLWALILGLVHIFFAEWPLWSR